MSTVKVIKTLQFGPGVTFNIKLDESEPETSVDRYATEVHCADGGELSVPSHWHKNHTERMIVIKGRLEITLDGKKIIVNAGDAPLMIPPRVVHSVKGFKGEEVVAQEQALPGGSYKAEFFNDMLQGGTFKNPALILRSFLDGDIYLALPLYFRVFDEIFLTIFGTIARLFAPKKPKHL